MEQAPNKETPTKENGEESKPTILENEREKSVTAQPDNVQSPKNSVGEQDKARARTRKDDSHHQDSEQPDQGKLLARAEAGNATKDGTVMVIIKQEGKRQAAAPSSREGATIKQEGKRQAAAPSQDSVHDILDGVNKMNLSDPPKPSQPAARLSSSNGKQEGKRQAAAPSQDMTWWHKILKGANKWKLSESPEPSEPAARPPQAQAHLVPLFRSTHQPQSGRVGWGWSFNTEGEELYTTESGRVYNTARDPPPRACYNCPNEYHWKNHCPKTSNSLPLSL